MGVVNFLTAMGLFIGQSKEFFALLRDLAEDPPRLVAEMKTRLISNLHRR